MLAGMALLSPPIAPTALPPKPLPVEVVKPATTAQVLKLAPTASPHLVSPPQEPLFSSTLSTQEKALALQSPDPAPGEAEQQIWVEGAIAPSTAPIPENSLLLLAETPVPPLDAPTADPTEPPANSPAEASPTRDIFEEVFGQPQNQEPQQVIVPLIVNGQSAGQILVVVPGGTQTDVLVAAESFLATVTAGLRPEVADQLAAAVQADGTLNVRSIRELGIAINFDSSRLELQVSIPPALRAASVQTINGTQVPPELAQALPPSAVSGYLNLRGSQEIVWSGAAGQIGRQPLQLNFDGAINIEGWVLEGSFNFREGGSPAWQRGPLRLVHDDTQSAIRYQLGDITVPVRGYQASIPMVGFSMARNFALQPYRVTRPVSRFEFFLERPSTVEVFVNGQSVQTLRLEPGPQDIRNLPLNAGINGVQLVITDDLGRLERLDFATGVSGDLLAPGVQQFAYSLGFPALGSGAGVTPQGYDLSQPTLTLSHRFGVTDTLTLGGYLQADPTTQMVGVEGTWATTVGNIGWDAALSHDRDYGFDGAVRLYYDWLFQGGSRGNNSSLRLAAEYRGPNFMTVASPLPQNTTGLDLSLAYSQTIFDNTRMTLSGRYQFTRNQPSDAYSVALGLAHPLGPGMTLNASASYGQNAQGQTEPRLFIGISSALTRQRQFINASTTLGNNGVSNRLNWSYASPGTSGGLSTSLTATTNDRALSLLSQTRYRGYRADLTLDHRVHIPQGGSGVAAQATRLTWGTALVFADGVWGWSRPIDNSFAIVARQGTARTEIVQINPGPHGPTAQADALGPAVVPLSPYSLTTLSVDAPDLPLGSDLGASRYSLFPTYRSGTLIRVGTEATVLLRGTLTTPQGQPLELQHGRILSLSDPDWPTVEIITNRTGRFAVPGLKPGRYEIWLFGQTAPVTTFEIPPETTGVYTLAAPDDSSPPSVSPPVHP
jgi:outer membrane usher protein